MKTPKEIPWDQDLFQRLDALCEAGAKDVAKERVAVILENFAKMYGGTDQFNKMRSKLASVWDRIRKAHNIDTKI
jgi:hypothetical protein|nr:MAG TPA: hypothetical protein [Caudoviricetes sp.]